MSDRSCESCEFFERPGVEEPCSSCDLPALDKWQPSAGLPHHAVLFSGYTEKAYNALRAQLDSSTQLIEAQGDALKAKNDLVVELYKKIERLTERSEKAEAAHAALRKQVEDGKKISISMGQSGELFISFFNPFGATVQVSKSMYPELQPGQCVKARLVVEE